MKTARSIKQVRAALAGARSRGQKIGFVPTMGAFHEGHMSLMSRARRENDVVVVSLFVNPAQFAPGEDLMRYPRNWYKDRRFAASAGVDILFAPPVSEIYPDGAQTGIDVPGLSTGLCGAFRPGHFSGVALVVAKLLNIVQPTVMYLGQKDAQQVAVLRRMVSDLDFPVGIKVSGIVREPDGLALSSRNIYLSDQERREAAMISVALRDAGRRIAQGEIDARKIILTIKKLLNDGTGASIEYVSCVDPVDLKPVRRINGRVLVAVAVRFGNTRLIDNIVVSAPRQVKRIMDSKS